MTPSLTALRLYVAVVEERSFTAAASRENATQSGVSQQVRKLEDRFGVRLIVRERGAVRPTPAGEHLYRRAVALLYAAAELDQEMRGYAVGIEGEAVVGLMSALTRCALGPALRDFMARHPNASVQVVEAISDRLIEQVAAGSLDAAVVPAVDPPDGVHAALFRQVPEMYVGRPSSDTHMVPIDLAAAGPLRLVLPGAANLRQRRVLAHLAAVGAVVEDVLELDSMFGAFEFVANSGYAAIVPAVMVLPEILDGRLCVRPLAGPSLTLDLAAIRPVRRPLPATAAAFLDRLGAELDAAAAIWAG